MSREAGPPGGWRAEWIASPARGPQAPDLAGCPWVWCREAAPGQAALFRTRLDLPHPRDVRAAWMAVGATGPFELFVNGQRAASGTYWSTAYRVRLLPYLVAGSNEVLLSTRPTGNPPALAVRISLTSSSGEQAATLGSAWDSAPAGADGRSGGWRPAAEVGRYGDREWGSLRLAGTPTPAPYLRRAFHLDRAPQRATAYATALGIYELRVNGEPVSDDLAPGWTDYGKRLQYQVYDVAPHLRPGENVLGLVLADGWYAGHVACVGREVYGGYPLRARLQLQLERPDGAIATDLQWRASSGAVQVADLICGEERDGRLEPSGWDRPGFDDADWAPVVAAEPPTARLVPQESPPVRVWRELPPVSDAERGGSRLWDFGQNLAGRLRLEVTGGPGQRLYLRHAEALRPDGGPYLDNLRGAWQTDVFTLRGGREVLEPRFTVHGFRYAELGALDGFPVVHSVRALALGSDFRETGSFSCANPLLERLHEAIRWTLRSNTLSVPTDCPNRDERMGWLADGLSILLTAALTHDVCSFYRKWLDDIADAQYGDGSVAHVAPDVLAGGGGEAGWADAIVLVPWLLYQYYGDPEPLEAHYEAMRAWVEHCLRASRGGLRPAEGFGDWLAAGEDTPKDLVATAYFARSSRTLARAARLLGREGDATRYHRLAGRVRRAFQGAYLQDAGRLAPDTQTAYVLALAFDLLPREAVPAAAARLAYKVRSDGLATGYLGTRYLLGTLSRHGEHNLAYRLASATTWPSWGYMLENGATTLWERWDSWRDGAFHDPAMNSLNHLSLGVIGEWLYQDLAGMGATGPGWKRITFRPRPPAGLERASASVVTPRGRAAIAWEHDGEHLQCSVTVPPDAAGRLLLPGGPAGRPARVIALEPGDHHFSAPFRHPGEATT